MKATTHLERLRARAQGTLSRAENAELERELAADPALRTLAEDYALVHALTEIEPVTAASATRFEELERQLARPARRRVAAAAALLLLASAAFLAGRWSHPSSTPLYLSEIELDASPRASAPPADLPVQWADYDPRGAAGVRFLDDLAEAELLASTVARPLLVYGSLPGCPLCATLDSRVFSDPSVVELAERTVPVRVDLSRLPEAEQRSFIARGYPFLEIWRDDGRTAHSLTRSPDPGLFVESLHDGLEKSDATGEQPPWLGLRRAAGAFGVARAAELEGRLAEAERGLRALAEDELTPGAIAARARAGLARIAESARASLLEARAAAGTDPAAAEDMLRHALERFRGTRFERDLAAALARLERDGLFPALAEADRSA